VGSAQGAAGLIKDEESISRKERGWENALLSEKQSPPRLWRQALPHQKLPDELCMQSDTGLDGPSQIFPSPLMRSIWHSWSLLFTAVTTNHPLSEVLL